MSGPEIRLTWEELAVFQDAVRQTYGYEEALGLLAAQARDGNHVAQTTLVKFREVVILAYFDEAAEGV